MSEHTSAVVSAIKSLLKNGEVSAASLAFDEQCSLYMYTFEKYVNEVDFLSFVLAIVESSECIHANAGGRLVATLELYSSHFGSQLIAALFEALLGLLPQYRNDPTYSWALFDVALSIERPDTVILLKYVFDRMLSQYIYCIDAVSLAIRNPLRESQRGHLQEFMSYLLSHKAPAVSEYARSRVPLS